MNINPFQNQRFGHQRQTAKQFEALKATSLYCPKCKTAMPVREKLLLILPHGGEIYDYLCSSCGESLGERRVGMSSD